MVLEVAGVRLTAEIGLATVLGDSEDGLSIQEIAEKTGVDPLKLGLSIDQTGRIFLTARL
jgi:sugar/nucleoside kinase (ribokinase family)